MLTEKRIASTLILVETKESIARMNTIIGSYSQLIIGRQGIPLHNRDMSIISLVMEGTTDEIGAIAGQLGRLRGLNVKTAILKSLNPPTP
jgi:putative iron-only hydrogenase system regulator